MVYPQAFSQSLPISLKRERHRIYMKYDIENADLLNIVKNASYDELEVLSSDIREFLVNKISKTGGHLASNLGIVELTIALHRVFDSPRDKIIFDVGHQSYVHKILTGRAKDFDTLRKYKGMSGFPKTCESEHDVYETGHSSTSLSAALGMASARDLSGEDYEVVAVIGDGAMTGGLAYEALNNIGSSKSKVRIILNDNGMSISHNVGGLSSYLTKIRTSQNYLKTKGSVKSAVKKVPAIGTFMKDTKNMVKSSVLDEEMSFVENLGIKYLGPVDGYDIEGLCNVIKAANNIDAPTLIHVITTKGKGYEFAEKYPRKFHGIAPFNVEDGNLLSSSNSPTYSEIFGNKICELASKNDSIVAVAAAMGTATGLGKFWENFKDRYFDVGIAEEHAVVFSAGLAKSGYIPFVAIYSSFLQRAFDMMIEDVCLQNLHVVFCIDRAGLVGADGQTHHGQFDLSYLSMMPNMTILCPADGNQLEEMLEYSAYELDGPVAIRYPRGSAESEHLRIKPFKGENICLSKGSDVCILAVGNMLDTGIEVADTLRSSGYKVGVYNINRVKPFDDELANIDSKLVVTIEDNSIIGGFGQECQAFFCNTDKELMSFGIPDAFIEHGSVEQLRKECGLDAETISKGVLNKLEGKA